MSISKVSVMELQWNPNPDVNVSAALTLQHPICVCCFSLLSTAADINILLQG